MLKSNTCIGWNPRAIVLACAIIGLDLFSFHSFVAPSVRGQTPRGSDDTSEAVSSDAFLKQWSQQTRATATQTHAYPVSGFQEKKPVPTKSDKVQESQTASYSETRAPTVPPAAVSSASYAEPASPSNVGSGVDSEPTVPLLPTPTFAINTVHPEPPPPIQSRIHSWLGLDKQLPNFLVGYEFMSFRKTNDDGGGFTNGYGLDRFGREASGRYTVARLMGSMDQSEFVFTGPFHYERELTATNSVNSTLSTGALPASSLGPLNGADTQHQSHSAVLRSFEWNRRWSSDDCSSIMSGLRLIDYREGLEMLAQKGADTGRLQVDTRNLLVGGQLGIQLGRPLSQRFSAGYGANFGMYGNFARGSLQIHNGSTILSDKSDYRLRLTTQAQANASLRYQITTNTVINAGYECWYFPALSTVADQRFGDVLSATPLSLRTGDDQLFRGWYAGIAAKF